MYVYESKDIEGWGQVCGGGAPHIDRSTRKRGPRDAVTVLSGVPPRRQDMARSEKNPLNSNTQGVTASHRNLESSIDTSFTTHTISRELFLKRARHTYSVWCGHEGSNDVASAPNTRTTHWERRKNALDKSMSERCILSPCGSVSQPASRRASKTSMASMTFGQEVQTDCISSRMYEPNDSARRNAKARG